MPIPSVRSSESVRTVIGFETTAGTAVSATRRLNKINFSPKRMRQTQPQETRGSRQITAMRTQRRMAEIEFDGRPDYNELCAILAPMYGVSAPNSLQSGNAFEWLMKHNPKEGDDPNTITLFHGDESHARMYTFATTSEIELGFNQSDETVKGKMLARFPSDIAAAPTNGITVYDDAAMVLNDVTIYLDPTFANIGQTALADAFSVSVKVGEKYKRKHVLNRDFQSFKSLTQPRFPVEITLIAEEQEEIREIIDAMLADVGAPYFLRIEAEGPVIPDSDPEIGYKFEFDAAVLLSAEENTDFEDIFSNQLNLTASDNPDFQGSHSWRFVNAIETL